MINYDLKKIKAIIFDIDGVLSAETITLSSEGVPLRTVNIKDGYAIQLAMKLGLRIVILTGANVPSIRRRYEGLGVEDIYIGCAIKIETYESFLQKYHLADDEVMYMGDDIPDYKMMLLAGIKCCPADAAEEIMHIADYVSPRPGGNGAVRDVIQHVLTAQGNWFHDDAFVW